MGVSPTLLIIPPKEWGAGGVERAIFGRIHHAEVATSTMKNENGYLTIRAEPSLLLDEA